MLPDSATLGVATAAVFAVNLAFSLNLHLSKQGYPGDRLWIAGQALLLAGFVLQNLLALPGMLHDVVAEVFLLAANLFFAHSVWTFRRGRTFPVAWYGLLSPALVALWAVEARGPLWQLAAFDFFLAGSSLLPAILMLRKPDDEEAPSLRLVGVSFATYALLALVGCLLNVSAVGDEAASPLSYFNTWFYLGALVMAAITSFGFYAFGSLHFRRVVRVKDREISLQNERLREQNRSKDLFFSIIAHDLRGPISGVARYTRKHLLGKMTGLEAKHKEVETLAAALDKTNDFLEKLLWWSRSQLQDWSPSWTQVNLEKVFDETWKVVGPLAQAKEIMVRFPPVQPLKLMADEECVTLILVNLMTNAIKFSHPLTTVKVETALAGKSFELTVVDEGIGMDEKTLERLFLIENKLNSAGTQGEAGSGMGLILAQSLAQRNDGGLEIHSQPGVGTRATLWLPLRNE